MWKKDETPMPSAAPEAERTPPPPVSPTAPTPAPASAAATSARPERATIGRSITIRGDVTGDEDLLIQGRVDGSIDLKNHAVTIGSEGEVKASVSGRVVIVEGSVEGNIKGEEQVILRSAARVQGDITAPRLALEDGARFRGGVDMGEVAAAERSGAGAAQSSSRREPAPSGSTASSEKASEKASEKTSDEGKSAAGASGASASSGSSGGKGKGSADLVSEARA